MAETLTQKILRQSLDLSYSTIEKEHPNWSKTAVDDYFYKQSNINSLAVSGEGVEAQVILNTAQIEINVTNIGINAGKIADNAADISTNAQNLTNHINDPTDAHNASAIHYNNVVSGLTADNAQAAIDELESELVVHIASDSAHGVTGDNVGTLDYASAGTGGVVLRAVKVTDAVDSTVSVDSPDAAAAPIAYDQAQIQTIVTLANETKGDVNQLVTDVNAAILKINAFLLANQNAKQMAP